MRNSTWPIISILVVAILLIGGFFFLDAKPVNDLNQAAPGVGGGPGEKRVTVSDIITNPNQYVARTVTLEGKVSRVLTPQIFVLGQMETITGDEILVIINNQVPENSEETTVNPFNDADQVTITGTVTRLSPMEIERDFAIDLDPQVEVAFDNRPVITASDVTTNR